MNETFLAFTAIALLRINEKLNDIEASYVFYLYLHNRGWFVSVETVQQHFPAALLVKLKNSPKSEFIAKFKRAKEIVGVK